MKNQDQIQELLDAYYQGNNSTIEQFFLWFGDNLVDFAHALLKDLSKAKDAVQDVMIKLLEIPTEHRREKFRPNPTNILGALKMRVRNRSIDLIRQRTRQREVDIKTLFTLQSDTRDTAQFVLNDELRIALKKLNDIEKRVLKKHLEGYSNQEIQETMNLDNTPRVIKQRIKRKLKREILRLRINN